jgi:hypothetical protein
MMRIRHGPSGELIVTAGDVFPAVLGGGAVALLGTAVYDVTAGSRGTDRMVGLLTGAAVLTIGAMAGSERSRFEFMPHARTIVWRRGWPFLAREGEVRFDDVRAVEFQVAIGSVKVLRRRLALRLHDDTEVRLTTAYAADVGGELRAIADQMRTMLGLPDLEDSAAERR